MRIMYTIGALFGLVFVAKLFFWAVSYSANPTPQGIERAGALIAEAVVPWWLPVVEALACIGGIVGAVLVLVFMWRLLVEDAI